MKNLVSFVFFSILLHGCSSNNSPVSGGDTGTNTEEESDNPQSTSIDSNSGSDWGGDTDVDGGTDTEIDRDTDTDTDMDSNTDTATDTDSDTDTNSNADTDEDVDTGFDTENISSNPIPCTCAEAATGTSTVGCLFYAADLDQIVSGEKLQFSVVVSNVNIDKDAHVVVMAGGEDGWEVIEEVDLSPMDLYQFDLPSLSQNSSGLLKKGAYKVTSDSPIIAYQFNPIEGSGSATTDASLLYPVSAYDEIYDVVGWENLTAVAAAYFTVVAAYDGTEVFIEPSVEVIGGGEVPESAEPFSVSMDEGDVLNVFAAWVDGAPLGNLTGSRITTNKEHPVAVFTAHECAMIPTDVPTCDHLEEQMPGLQFWGTDFVASSLPNRSENSSDIVLWQIYAGEDNTTVEIKGASDIGVLPDTPVVLNERELLQFYVDSEYPVDFFVEADLPIALMQYMTSCSNLENDIRLGDPAQVYIPPIQQYLQRYVVLVPSSWENDYLVISREVDVEVLLDGNPIDDALFSRVSDTGFEVARVHVEDGIHRVESESDTAKLGLIVVGFDDADSYAYTGGMGTSRINPIIII